MLSSVIGCVGSVTLMLCMVPQLIKTIREGNADGLALGYIVLAEFGLTCMLVYVLTSSVSPLLIVNYLYAVVSFGVLLKYKLFPRR